MGRRSWEYLGKESVLIIGDVHFLLARRWGVAVGRGAIGYTTCWTVIDYKLDWLDTQDMLFQ